MALGLSVLVSAPSSGAPPGSAPGGLAPREGRMVPEVRVLSSLLGLALLCFPLDSHARARKWRRGWVGGREMRAPGM